MSAVDLGPPGKDNVYGAGRIDAVAAVEYVLENLLPGDLVVPEGQTWTLDNLTIKLPPGAGVIVNGTLNASGSTFTARDPQQGWGGVAVYFTGTLDFDGVTVSDAEVGVEVFSDHVLISDSDFFRNGVGIASEYVARYCPDPGTCDALPAPERSSFVLIDSRITDSQTDGTTTTGVGIAARNTDAEIRNTLIDYNDGFGLVVWNADIFPYRENIVVGNGDDGLRFFQSGDLRMTNLFDADGLNCVTDNTDEEIQLSTDAYLFMGNADTGGENAVFDDDLDADTYLILRNQSSDPVQGTIPALRTYWGTGGAPPPGAFGASVDAASPLAASPVNCTLSAQRPASGATLLARSQAGGGEHGRELEWLREEIYAGRAALTRALAGEEGARDALRALYRTQRLDRDDVLGEHAETMALVATTRALLAEDDLSEALQAAGEAALIAEVADALRRGLYDEADALVRAHEDLVRDEDAQRSLSLHAAMAAEADGRTDEAYARVEAVYQALVAEERFEEAEGPEMMLAALATQQGRSAPPEVVALGETQSRSRAEVRFALGAPYPNPSAGSVTVPLTLGRAAEARVVVFDMLGRRVAVLAEGLLGAGRHALTLEAAGLPAGVYLVRADAEGEPPATARITLIR